MSYYTLLREILLLDRGAEIVAAPKEGKNSEVSLKASCRRSTTTFKTSYRLRVS